MKRLRTTSRIIAMIILYNNEMNNELDIAGIKSIIDAEEANYDNDFVDKIINGVISFQKDIDYLISINLQNYTIDRLSFVDRALLRIGVYELLKTPTPINIIINEIVDISKVYSETDEYQSSKFNNSLLDRIAKGVRNGSK